MTNKRLFIVFTIIVCCISSVFLYTFFKKSYYLEADVAKISIELNVDNTKIGKYIVNYSLDIDKNHLGKKIEVEVLDKTVPNIELIGDTEIRICKNKKYDEEGYSAIDNYDGDLTDKVEVNEVDNEIIYMVKDSSSNEYSVSRYITYYDDKPIIELNGNDTITLYVGAKYKELGVKVVDDCDEELNVETTGNVNTLVAGTYELKYSVTDSSSNTSEVTRTIVVKEKSDLADNKKDFIKEFEKYIKDNGYKVSIGYYELDSGESYSYNDSVTYYGASLAKVVDALYVYSKFDKIDAATKEDVKKAISRSDNGAHYNLVKKIGFDNLRDFGHSLGMKKFLNSGSAEYYAYTTVNDQIALWKNLYEFVQTSDRGDELKQFFFNNFYNSLVFNCSPAIMHKYGLYNTMYHDVGIVFTDKPYIIVILTSHGRGDYKNIVSELSEMMYKYNQLD